MHLPRIEKDPIIQNLTNDILTKIAEISKPEPGTEQLPQDNNIKLISPEEALIELNNILKQEN